VRYRVGLARIELFDSVDDEGYVVSASMTTNHRFQRGHRLLRRHLVFVADSFANHHYVGAHARLRRKLINSVAAGPDDAGF
jgi:hypothetical protein